MKQAAGVQRDAVIIINNNRLFTATKTTFQSANPRRD